MCISLGSSPSSGSQSGTSNQIKWRVGNMISVMAVMAMWSLFTTQVAGQGQCPSICSCIWRSNKQHSLCENQGLIGIPTGIGQSTQVLNLNKNNFQILPSRVFQERGLINLQKVFLAECKLGVIAPDAFLQLTNLVELDLSSNLLTSVPSDAFEHEPKLNIRRLQLNGNPIRAVKKNALAMLPHLNNIELSDCQIDLIEPGAFSGLSQLQYLKLDGNRLSTLSALVLQDLPPLFRMDLHKNPWNCDCELRQAYDWIKNNNVPQGVPPSCKTPQRMESIMWNTVQSSEEFACTPKIVTRDTDVTGYIGLNATFTCSIWSQPGSRVTWLLDDHQVHRNLTASTGMLRNERLSFTEEHSTTPDTVSTTLTIMNIDQSDQSRIFVCHAENSAGSVAKNFTLSVLPVSSHPAFAGGWSKVEVAGGLVGLLLVAVVSFVLVTVCLLRLRRPTGSPESPNGKAPLPQIDVLKNTSTPVGLIKAKNGVYDDKTITADGKPRPETGASSGYGSNGVTPDLTSVATRNGYLADMSLNGYGPAGHVATTGYMLSQPGDYMGDNGGLLQQVPVELKSSPYHTYPANMSYDNFEICDAYNYGGSEPSVSEHQQVHYGHTDGHTFYDSQGYPVGLVQHQAEYWAKVPSHRDSPPPMAAMSAEQHHAYLNASVQQSPHSSSQHLQMSSGGAPASSSSAATASSSSASGLPSAAMGHHHNHVNVVGQGSYNVGHPTVVRYSPDEGYAEEPAASTYTLEGTEV
ncbi:Slit -like protein 3 protein [Halotydeus destructor]|nr:Slit -like protein 3 protein [Halotydeus destructor]